MKRKQYSLFVRNADTGYAKRPFGQFSLWTARESLNEAMKVAHVFVRRGQTVKITCGSELVWEGDIAS